MMNGYNNYETTREQTMNELQNMYTYFSQKKALYDEFDKLDNLVAVNSRPISKAGKTWGIILIVFGGLMTIIGFNVGGPALFVGIVLLILGICLIASRSNKVSNAQKAVKDSVKRMEQIAQELAVHYNNYGYCQVGLEYTFPRTIEQIYEVIRQGRADTIKEAMNLIIYDEHNAEMERLQRSTAQAAWQTCAASTVTAGFTAANYFQNR